MPPEERTRLLEERVRLLEARLEGFLATDKFVIERDQQILDARNIQVGRTNGTVIATETDQKLAFHGATPVVQASSIAHPSITGTDLDGGARTAIDAMLTALENKGIIAS